MIHVEKIKFNGINKDLSPAAVDNGGNRVIVNPIIDALNVRYLTSDHSDSLVAESIKGTTAIANGSLPAGTNKCIGSYEDKQNNLLIYFIHNSNNDHCIFKFKPSDGTVTLIIQNSVLNFQDNPLYLITGVGSINDLLFFSDGSNPQRCININRDYTYVGFTEADITLVKNQPRLKPIIFPGTTGETTGFYEFRTQHTGAIINAIYDRNLQFSYRYIYLDNEQSVIAPYSVLSTAEIWPDINNIEDTKIVVRVPVTSTINQYVKKIEVLYRENNTGTWKVWKTITPTNGPSFYDNDFSGTEFIAEVAESESSKISESVPNFSKSLCIQKNRLFLSDDESGFNDAILSGTLTPTVSNEIGNPNKPYLKANSRYKVGIALWDGPGRSVGVIHTTEIRTTALATVKPGTEKDRFHMGVSLSFSTHTIGTGSKTFIVEKEFAAFLKNSAGTLTSKILTFYVTGTTNFVRGNITSVNMTTGSITMNITTINGVGSHSDWAVYYFSDIDHSAFGAAATHIKFNKASVASTIILNLNPKAKYFSIVMSENLTYEDYFQCWTLPYFYKYDGTNVPSNHLGIDDTRIYFGGRPTSLEGWSKTHLQLPKELPVVPDSTWYVRLLGWGLNAASSQYATAINTIERVQGIVGGDFLSVNTFGVTDWEDLLAAPTEAFAWYRLAVEIFKPKTITTSSIRFFEITDRFAVNTDGTLTVSSFQIPGDTYVYSNFHSWRKPKFTNPSEDQFDANNVAYKEKANLVVESPTPTTVQANVLSVEKNTNKATRQFVLDYSKKAYYKGVVLVEVEDNRRVQTSKTKIRFSNKFIQDSTINGLNSFDAGNYHSVSSERGQIKKLLPIGNNILSVHERACTTLYVEEGIIKTADNQESLAVTSNVIGHDRKLILDFGSYHPESVKEIDGMAFGFDVYKGIVWRYTNEGLFPVSDYGMKEYFRQKGAEYLPIKDTCKILGAIDNFNKEYVITFRKADGSGETWAFNYTENKWVCRMSFIPEMYGTIGNDLYSFVSGQLWKHNSNATHNYFYGVQYERKIKVAVNPYPSKKKIGNGIQIAASDPLSVDIDEKIIKAYTPSGQETYAKFDEFDIKEKTHYGPILKDINTPNIEAGQIALRDGDDMRGEYFTVELITSLASRAPVRFMNLTYTMSEFSQ